MKGWIVLLLLLSASACRSPREEPDFSGKLGFDLDSLDEAGLHGPPHGLRALSYEFCIPAGEEYEDEVRRIDFTLRLSRSPGRVGCGSGQVLCIGNTHQPEYRQVLRRLASLDYVERIDPHYAE